MADRISTEQTVEAAEAHLAKDVRTIDIFFLGVTTVIGGQFISWNKGLQGGFWEYFCSVLLIAINYLNLNLCLAEMTSALPFSGGIFGFIRATSGPYLGFCVGCCETLQYVAYAADVAMVLGNAVAISFGFGPEAEPIFAVIYFIVTATLNIRGGNGFWRFNYSIAILSIIILFVYIFSTISGVNYDEYVKSIDETDKFDGFEMMRYFPCSMWFFLGSETLPLYGRSAANPRKSVPEASIACIVVLFCTSLFVFFVTSTQYPGIFKIGKALLPFNYGFERVFNVDQSVSIWLSIPAVFATGFGFTSAFGKQISSMARSKLLPDFYKAQTKKSQQPYRAILLGTFVAFVITAISKAIYPPFQQDLFLLCCLASYFVYINTFIGFIIFRNHYSSISRHYVNPLGVPGAVIGIMISSIGVISVLFFQGMNFVPIILFVLYMGALSGLYAWFIHKIQVFSADEQKALFTAYVINANVTGKKKRKKQKKRLVISDTQSAPSDSNKPVRDGSQDGSNHQGGIQFETNKEHTNSLSNSHRHYPNPYGSGSSSGRVELECVIERPSRQSESGDVEHSSSRQGEGGVGESSEDEESSSAYVNSTGGDYYDSNNHVPHHHPPGGIASHLLRPLSSPTSARPGSQPNTSVANPSSKTTAPGGWFQPQLPREAISRREDDRIVSEVRPKTSSRPTTAENGLSPSNSSKFSAPFSYVKNYFSSRTLNADRRNQVIPVVTTTLSKLDSLEEESPCEHPIFIVEKPNIPVGASTNKLRASASDINNISVHGASSHIIATSISNSSRQYLPSTENQLHDIEDQT